MAMLSGAACRQVCLLSHVKAFAKQQAVRYLTWDWSTEGKIWLPLPVGPAACKTIILQCWTDSFVVVHGRLAVIHKIECN